MEPSVRNQLIPGATVTVTQQVPHGTRVWTSEVHGTIVSFEQAVTGSWFAHSQDDKLWLDRLTLKLEDGEITALSLDDYSRVQVEAAPTTDPAPAAQA